MTTNTMTEIEEDKNLDLISIAMEIKKQGGNFRVSSYNGGLQITINLPLILKTL